MLILQAFTPIVTSRGLLDHDTLEVFVVPDPSARPHGRNARHPLFLAQHDGAFTRFKL